jgi:hypothetical protein
MNEELLKKKYLPEGNYILIYYGTSKSAGGMLISPFHDSILENAWLELNDFDKRECNFFVVKIENYKRPLSEFRNFKEDSLKSFFKKIEEDSEEYLKGYRKVKIYNSLKSHCYKILGEKYFK